MKTQIEKLEALTADWKAAESKRKETILSVLGKIDSLTTSRMILWDGDEKVYTYLEPGTYRTDLFVGSERQWRSIDDPGMYLLSRKAYSYGIIALDTDDGFTKLRFTKRMLPKLVNMIGRAVSDELEILEAANKATQTIQSIADLLS